jgi:RNA polymerase sigma-70 factor (ECF subfamily)
MHEVRAGNLERLAVLFERHSGALYNHFLRMTNRDVSTSEDLVQEVFLRMLNYRTSYTGEGEFGVWMYRIARNVRIDYYKRHKREISPSPNAEETADTAISQGEKMQKVEQLDILNDALARLDPDQREILILSRFQEMKYREIAELLGCSPEALKLRAFRAMSELRAIYFRLSGESR